MTVSLSPSLRRALHAQQTDEAAAVLAVITHPDLDAPVRLSSHPGLVPLTIDPLTYGLVSGGETYPFALMSVSLPDDKEGSIPKAQMVFENVDRDSVALIRSISSPPTLSLHVVAVSSPDVVEVSYTGLQATSASYDESKVTLDMSREGMTGEPWPVDRMTRARFPGLYR